MRVLLTLLLLPVAALAADGGLVPYEGRSIADVIDEFRSRGYAFAYSTNLVDDNKRVTAEPKAEDPLGIVREILEPHGLTIRTEAGVHLVVRTERDATDEGSILLIVTAEEDDDPVAGVAVSFSPVLAITREIEAGIFHFEHIAPGRYELVVEATGFEPVTRIVDVWPGEAKVINVRLDAARPEIETIAVSASRYEILRDIAASRISIDRRTIQTMPDIGDDPLRALQRLPGAAASGTSAETHVRGGDRGEIGIMLNGQKLFDPFHVRDYQSVFSTIDSRAIESVEVYTGGFPVRYGNRISGMVLMESLEPLRPRHTEIGLSVYNTSLLTAGNEADRHWLFSARRGNLDLVINPKFSSPSYYDLFAEYSFDPSPDMTLSLNGLYANDRVEIITEDDPEELERVVSKTGNAQVWLRLDNRWSDELSSKTVLSATWFDNLRRGSVDDEEKMIASVFDDRRVTQIGFRQDYRYRRSDRHLLQWGLQVKQSSAEYDYRNSAEYFGLQALFEGRDEPASVAVAASPEGASYALYFADRWKLASGAMLEWGLRWDDQTYTELSSDSRLSPRFSLLQSVGENTELRLSWGRYHQTQEINELQVEDGITNFWPAQRADHLILGLRHLFKGQYSLRLEVFQKDIDEVRPRFENLFDPLGVIPEVQPDRVRLDPASARSRGLEVSIDRSDGPLTWWASYVLSKATDRINGRDELRSWDQRHAFQGGLSFASEKWEWALAANVHTGWPLTELTLVENGIDQDGGVIATPGVRNAGRHETFAGLDIRVARKWKLRRGSLMAFVEVSNLTNRRNPCCLDWDLVEDRGTGELVLERGVDYWLPLLPAVGVLWEF